VKYAVSELSHLYVEMFRLGAPLEMMDIGGGLGIDYDGTQSATESSTNYTLDQYASDVIHRIRSVCDDAGVPHPHLLTESGRALVAHSGVLICEALSSRVVPDRPDAELVEGALGQEDVPQPLLDLMDAYERLADGDPTEVFNDAVHARDEALSLFNLGYMDVACRAASEELFWAIGSGLLRRLGEDSLDEIDGLPGLLGDLYFCNFSLFQSLPDSWAIDQIFPIVPIHRLDEEPTQRGILADITCDSDGRIDRFADELGPRGTLQLHPLLPDENGKAGKEPYYLGIFLIGAYQETLGDLHNLLGDTHAVHVRLTEDGRWRIDEVVEGDTVREVLEYVQFVPDEIRRTMRMDIEDSVDAGKLTLPEGVSLKRFLDLGMGGYTYLE
jgi:arginine decarboxylase